jgi:hypothetical protein
MESNFVPLETPSHTSERPPLAPFLPTWGPTPDFTLLTRREAADKTAAGVERDLDGVA